jgi:hypothetical protein
VSTGAADQLATDLVERGYDVTRDHGLMSWPIEVAHGPLAGKTVEVGVEEKELVGFPSRAPHWIHAPDSIKFCQSSPTHVKRPGWTGYSRGDPSWGRHPDHVAGLLAYLRAVLEAADER